MPAEVLDDPLGMSCVFSDGRRAVVTLGEIASAQLARDLLTGLAELVHPHGTVDSAGSIRHYVRALRVMDAALAEHGFTGGAADLRRSQVAEFWMGTTGAKEACTRRMLLGLAAAGDTLDGAARGHDPAEGGRSLDNLRWLLARNGPMSTPSVAAHAGTSANAIRRVSLQAAAGLFPHLDVTLAYVLLFSVYSGIVPDGVDDLATSDIDWAGDSSVLLSYVKRRTAAESLNLPRRAVRLLDQWLDHSRLLRGFVPPPSRDQLWLGLRQRGHADVTAGPVHRNAIRRWLARNGVTGEDGQVLTLHRHRIRTTHESMRDKRTWKG